MFSPLGHKLHSTEMDGTLSIARRFRGPLTSANGGYAAGLFAGATGPGGREVTLRLPPPLETPLTVVPEDGRWVLLDGDALVAEATAAEPDVTPPAPPTFAAVAAAPPAAGTWAAAVFDECFVCGTRPEGDGLEIHARPIPGRPGLVADTWIAHEACPEVVWAAIDCPGAYAVLEGSRGEPVLGRITARVDRLPAEGERCVVVGWPLGADGRKLHAATALYGEDGSVLARSRQLWIAPH
jgi:hypothetical protein